MISSVLKSLAVLSLGLLSVSAQSTAEDFATLAASHGGVIKLNSKTYDAITAPERDWSVVIELTALGTQVSCPPCLEFAPNFEEVAKAWKKVPKAKRDQHFFARLDFNNGQDIFRRLGLNSAPFVNFHPATTGPLVKDHPSTQTWTYDFASNSFDAETFAQILSPHTPVRVPYSKPLNYALICSAVGAVLSLFAAYWLFGNIILAFLSSRWIWGVGSLALIITMLSGFMFCRIRHAPYAGQGRGPNGQAVLNHIAGGYQNQYGAEVQIIGGLYTILAASQIALIVLVPNLPGSMRQRSAIYIWTAVFWLLFSVLVAIFKQKHSGYPFKLLL